MFIKIFNAVLVFSVAVLAIVCTDNRAAIKQQRSAVSNIDAIQSSQFDQLFAQRSQLNTIKSNISYLQADAIVMRWRIDMNDDSISNELVTLQKMATLFETMEKHLPKTLNNLRITSQPQIHDGIPSKVYDSITADAQEKWKNDFDMQAYEIKKQVTAYKELHE